MTVLELPIEAHRADLVRAIRDHQVVIVAGETGSGKSTRLPSIAIDAGRGSKGMIGLTQPRRIAARAIATRVAEERGEALGHSVGFKVRFHDTVSSQALIKVMTDGMLLNELHGDHRLSAYDTIIVDEAHERSLNIDFLLGSLARLLHQRPDLHLIVTSATIDTDRFSTYFNNAPVFLIEGRTFPVEINHRDLAETDLLEGVRDATEELLTSTEGDVLVFLPTERDIREAAEVLRAHFRTSVDILTLYAQLPLAEQARVFTQGKLPRVILATNVAETSLTVPNITGVVDSGLARISRYSTRTRIQRLPIEEISQSSATQRAGRAGRVRPGRCIRLYDETNFGTRPQFTEPEILRTNLASVILTMESARLGEIESFPFLDPPEPRAIRDGIALLFELHAINSPTDRRLTAVGRQMARLPIDPRLARMLVAAHHEGALASMLPIVAMLGSADPRSREFDPSLAAVADKAPRSDALAIEALWHRLGAERSERSGNQFKKFCIQHGLHYLRVREWIDVHQQLLRTAMSMRWQVGEQRADPQTIHRVMLAGLCSHVGQRRIEEKRQGSYRGARGQTFSIWPGSAMHRSGAEWIVASELIETSQPWARVVMPIKPQWIIQVAPHLVSHTDSPVQWDSVRGRAFLTRTSRLWSLTIQADQLVPLVNQDRQLARSLFIEHALIRGDWDHSIPVLEANRESLQRWQALEHFGAQVPHRSTLEEFFDRAIPDRITSGTDLAHWLSSPHHAERLNLDQAFDVRVDEHGYPTTIQHGSRRLAVHYRRDEASGAVQAHVEVGVDDVAHLDTRPFGAVIPARIPTLVMAMLRALPKPQRRQLHPIAAAVDALVPHVDTDRFFESLVESINRQFHLGVVAGDFDLDVVPLSERINIVVLDTDGSGLAQDPSVVALARQLEERRRLTIEHNRTITTDIHAWDPDWGDLSQPRELAASVTGLLALATTPEGIELRMVHSRSEQRAIHWDGLRALIDPATLPGKKSLTSWMTARRRQLLTGGPYPTAAAFLQDVHLATLDHLIDEFGMAWTAERYRQLERFVRSEYTGVAQQVASIGLDICASHARLTTRLAALTTEKAAGTVADITQSLNELVFDGCLTHAGTVRIGDIEQFVAGMHVRLDRLAGHLDRDLAQMDRLNEIDSLVRSASRLLSTQEVDTLIWDWFHIRHQVFTGQPAGLREFTARVLSIPGVRSTHLS